MLLTFPVFLQNQRNRKNKFEVWVKAFQPNIRPILNDLEAFYKSLPFPELKKFNRVQIEQSLDALLRTVYERTRRYDMTNLNCKDLIGNEMKKLMEQKQLKNINESLGVFLKGIKELIEPLLDEDNLAERELSAILQKSHRGKTSLLQQVHESNLHRSVNKAAEESLELPSFDETLLGQVPVRDLQSMYKKIAKGTYKIPDVPGTAAQALRLEQIERLLGSKVQRARSKREVAKQLAAPISNFNLATAKEGLPPNAVKMFKRIIGSIRHLDTIEMTDDMMAALQIILECCDNVDENICKGENFLDF